VYEILEAQIARVVNTRLRSCDNNIIFRIIYYSNKHLHSAFVWCSFIMLLVNNIGQHCLSIDRWQTISSFLYTNDIIILKVPPKSYPTLQYYNNDSMKTQIYCQISLNVIFRWKLMLRRPRGYHLLPVA